MDGAGPQVRRKCWVGGAEHPPPVWSRRWAEGLWGQGGLFAVQLSWGWHTAEIQVSARQQHVGCTLTAPSSAAVLHDCAKCWFMFGVREKRCQITKLPQVVRAHSRGRSVNYLLSLCLWINTEGSQVNIYCELWGLNMSPVTAQGHTTDSPLQSCTTKICTTAWSKGPLIYMDKRTAWRTTTP